jgi:hypothetical protein
LTVKSCRILDLVFASFAARSTPRFSVAGHLPDFRTAFKLSNSCLASESDNSGKVPSFI